MSDQGSVLMSKWKPRVQVPPEHYKAAYDDWDKWISYYWQIRNVMDRSLADVLEVGIGSRVVSSYLKRNDVHLTTVDLDPELGPDCVASVTQLPFQADTFDAVVCCEVLEHMPFEQTRLAIREIYRITRRYAFIAVPHFVLSFALLIRFPVLHLRELRLRIPCPRPLRTFGEHLWECGRPGYPIARVRRAFTEVGFRIASERRPPTNYSSCFFVLQKG